MLAIQSRNDSLHRSATRQTAINPCSELEKIGLIGISDPFYQSYSTGMTLLTDTTGTVGNLWPPHRDDV